MAINWADYYDQAGNQYQPRPRPASINPISPNMSANRFQAGIDTQSHDYDNIMQGYRNLLDQRSATPNIVGSMRTINPSLMQAPPTINAQHYNYTASPDLTGALSQLKDYSSTGGISDAEAGTMRARGVSPIRAVYANAQRGVDRSRRLNGGYSPSYNAATTRMARGLSSQIADKTTDVEGQIAGLRQQGRISLGNSYANAAGAESELRNKYGAENTAADNHAAEVNANNTINANRFNAGATNEANTFNANAGNTAILQGTGQDLERQLQALSGMRSLFGTNPALIDLFGRQAAGSAQFQNTMDQQNRTTGLDAISRLIAGLR